MASAVVLCNCFGGEHAVSTNCKACGRIHCVKERTDTGCLMCLAELEAPVSAETVDRMHAGQTSLVEAYRAKDRLLGYDKEHAKRTNVYDAEGDYYSSETWLTKDEKKKADAKEKKRRAALNERGRAKGFRVAVDLTGRVVVKDVIGDSSGDDDGTDDDADGVGDKSGDGDGDKSGDADGHVHRGSGWGDAPANIGGGNVGRAATVYEALQESMRDRHLSVLERKVVGKR